MKLNSRFTFEKVRHDRDNDIHLVLDLIAPKAEFQAVRPPLCIIPVLDCSGSMGGDKLHYAKQSLLKLVEHLTSDDYLGLVSFADDARVDAVAEKMTSSRKDHLKGLIGRFTTRGGTNLSTGLLNALEMANSLDLSDSTLVRVILFTDGQPTHGVTSKEGLCELLTKQMGRASVSAFGYGVDACQDLLTDVATKGNGNYAFVKDPDSALSAFGKELGGLLSTYGQNISISVQPSNGHQISEVLTDASVEEEVDGLVRIKLPQILTEETLNVVLSTKMSKQKSAGPRQVNSFDVSVSYQALDETGKLVTRTLDSKAKIQFVKEGEEQTQPTRDVDEIVARAQLVRAQIAAEEAAKRNDFKTAGAIMGGVTASAGARGLVGVAAVGNMISTNYAAPGAYAASAGRRQSLQRSAARGMSASADMSAEDQEVFSSAGYVVSNASQALYAESFTSGEPIPTPDFGVSTPSSTPIGSGVGSNISMLWNGPPGGLQPPASTVTHATLSVTPPEPAKPARKVKKARSPRW